MRLFGYPYNDLVICKDSPDYLQSMKAYQYHKSDRDSIKAGLTSFAPKFLSDCQKINIDEMWNSFHAEMMSLREMYIPPKTMLRRLMRKQLGLFHRRTKRKKDNFRKE